MAQSISGTVANNAGIDNTWPSTCGFCLYRWLPDEAQKQIFLFAYYADEEAANNLAMVCQQVRDWIDPLSHASIILPMDYKADSRAYKRLAMFERTFKLRSKKFYERHVKKIYTNNKLGPGSSDFEIKLLPVCEGLERLECWSDPREELSAVLQTYHWENLRTLAVNIDLLPKNENTFLAPLFEHVTHLDIRSREHTLPSWKSLESLKKLTHMRVNFLHQAEMSRPRAMNCIITVAREARMHFPPSLKYFVILAPALLLCRVVRIGLKACESRRTIEDIQAGHFDRRILLGYTGNYLDCARQNIYRLEAGFTEVLSAYNNLASLEFPCMPRDYQGENEKDTWAQVEEVQEQRKGYVSGWMWEMLD